MPVGLCLRLVVPSGLDRFVFAFALPAMFEPSAGPGALFTRRSRGGRAFPYGATTGPLRFPGGPSRAFALL